MRCSSGAKVDNGSNRVIRGGSWNNTARNCTATNRNRNHPANRNNDVGFRLASSSLRRDHIVHGWYECAKVMTRPLSRAGECRTKRRMPAAAGRVTGYVSGISKVAAG